MEKKKLLHFLVTLLFYFLSICVYCQVVIENKASLEHTGRDSVGNKLYIFISFAMPKSSIRTVVVDARKKGIDVYIRGLVNNSFKDTSREVMATFDHSQYGVLIDPTLFKKFSIEHVPAFVVENNTNFDVLYGDISLDYAARFLKMHATK